MFQRTNLYASCSRMKSSSIHASRLRFSQTTPELCRRGPSFPLF